jgi:hypothetical protein
MHRGAAWSEAASITPAGGFLDVGATVDWMPRGFRSKYELALAFEILETELPCFSVSMKRAPFSP